MEMLEHIKARRTIRRFKPDPIKQEVLDRIFEAAMWAPSHANVQPWDFVNVGPQARARLLAIFRTKAEELLASPDLPAPRRRNLELLREDFGGAPTMVAVLSRPGAEPLEQLENPLSAAGAVQNMCLAAWSAGVGAVWLSLGAAPPVRPILAVPEGASVVALLAMGHPADAPPPPPPRDDYRTHLRQVP